MLARAVPRIRSLFALVCWSSIACTAESYVEMPPRDPSAHAILVVREGEQITARAYDAALAPPQIERGEGVRSITVLYVDATLDELYLTAGDLEFPREGDCA